MLNTMWTLIQTCTLIPTPFTRTCASRMAGTPLAPDKISCFSAQKPRLAQKQQHKQQQQTSSSSSRPSSRPLQSLSKISPGWVLTGGNFNAVRTRCKRGPNEVRNQILGDWPPKSPDKLFGSHTLSHSFQNSADSRAFSGGAEEEKNFTENLWKPSWHPPPRARVQSIFSSPSCGQPPPRCRRQRTAFWHEDHPKSYPWGKCRWQRFLGFNRLGFGVGLLWKMWKETRGGLSHWL